MVTSFIFEKGKRAERCVLNVLVTIPACSHERPERHAHCRVRDDGVPVLHVEPICARLRKLRVVLQELEQDDDEVVTPTPGDPPLWTRAKTKAQIWAKGPPDKRKKKRGNFLLQEYFRRGIYFLLQFLN